MAISGSTVAVGAPHDTEYAGGYELYGAVQLQNMATGATSVLRGPGPGGSDADFGISVAMSPSRIVVGAPGVYDSEGAVYVYSYSTALVGSVSTLVTTEIASFTSPSAQTTPSGDFGDSVAINANLVVVGAPFENVSGQTGAGHAYIINLQTGTIVMLSSPRAQLDGYFGYSVAISGSRVVVGAWDEENSTSVAVGFVYIYSASTGDLIQTLTSPSPDPNSGFGRSVAINGTIVAVGEPFSTAGDAYLFNLFTGSNASLASPTPVSSGYFGFSVGMNSAMVLVGAQGETSGGNPDAGNAYLFSLTNGSLITSDFAPPDWPAGGFFGGAVAENATNGILIGAPFERAGGVLYGGHAFFYSKIPLTLSSLNPTYPANPIFLGGEFGVSVGVNSEIVVGAPSENASGQTGAGHAYLLPSHTGPMITLTSGNPQLDGAFGTSVAASPYVVAVGAPDEDGEAGHVYLFNPQTGARYATLTSPNPQDNGLFGESVSLSPTYNYLVVGAPGEGGTGASGSYAGHVYIYNTTTDALFQTLTSPGVQAGGEYGWSVSAYLNSVSVGAPLEYSDTGRAYSYLISGGSADLDGAFMDPASSPLEFGSSVASGQGFVVVGAPVDENPGALSAGHAYVFSLSFGLVATLADPNSVYSGDFGSSVAVNGGTIVIGAPGETAFGITETGNVYLYSALNYALTDRYNDPIPADRGGFGISVAIGPQGVLVVGAPEYKSGNAYCMFL